MMCGRFSMPLDGFSSGPYPTGMDERPIPLSKIADDLGMTVAAVRGYADWSARFEGDEAVYPGGDRNAVHPRIAGEIGYGAAVLAADREADQLVSTPVEPTYSDLPPVLAALNDAAVLAEAAQRALVDAYARRDSLVRQAVAAAFRPEAIIRAARVSPARFYQIRNAGDEVAPPQ